MKANYKQQKCKQYELWYSKALNWFCAKLNCKQKQNVMSTSAAAAWASKGIEVKQKKNGGEMCFVLSVVHRIFSWKSMHRLNIVVKYIYFIFITIFFISSFFLIFSFHHSVLDFLKKQKHNKQNLEHLCK